MKTSDSRRRAYLSCPRKYALKYGAGIRSTVESPGRLMGKAFSLAIENWDSRATAPVFSEARENVMVNTLELNRMELECRMYAEEYMAEFREPDECEYEFDIPLMDGSHNHGFIDCVEYGDKGTLLVENKLLNPRFWGVANIAALKMDAQVLSYAHAWRHLHNEIPTVEYRVVKKSLVRRRNGEGDEALISRMREMRTSADKKFSVTRLSFSDDELDLFEEVMLQLNGSMQEKTEVYNSTSCSMFGGCEFLNLCTGSASAGEYVTEEVEV